MIALAVLSILVEGSGLLHVELTPVIAWLFLVASLVAGVAFDAWARRTWFGIERADQDARPVFRGVWVIAGLAFAAYALLWVPVYCRSEITWDGMTYHMPTVHLWARRGYVHWIELEPEAGAIWRRTADTLFNGYPKGGEVVAFLLARISSGKLANAPNLLFLPLAFFGVAFSSRQLGATRSSSAAAGLLFVTVPTIVAQAGSTYVDAAFASAVIAFAALHFAQLRFVLASPRKAIPIPLSVAAGAALGLAVGVKGPALGLGAVAALMLVVAMALRLRRPRRHHFERLRTNIYSLGLVWLVAMAVGGFWYARNAVVTGNPLYPVEVRIAGHTAIDGVPIESQIAELGNTPEHMRDWSTPRKVLHTWMQGQGIDWPIDATPEFDGAGAPLPDIPEWRRPRWPRSIRYFDARSGGLGVLWLIGGLPALVVLVATSAYALARSRGRERLRRSRYLVAIGLWLLTIALFFAIIPMAWWARYTLWLHAVGLPALAFAFERSLTTLDARPWLRRAALVPFGALVGLAFFEYAYAVVWSHTPAHFVGPSSAGSPRELWRGLTSMKGNGATAIYPRVDGLARDALTGDAVVAVGRLSVHNGCVLGQLSMPPGRRRWVAMPPEVGTESDAATRFVRRYSPRYVIWDHAADGDPPILMATATRWVREGSLMVFEFGHETESPTVITPK